MPPTPSGPRVVLVVGGTSGIGLATARQLVERGDTVVVGARDAGRVAAVAAELGAGVTGVALDLTDAASVSAAVERCVADHGRLDGVVTSAQTMAYGTVEQVPADVFAAVVDTAVDRHRPPSPRRCCRSSAARAGVDWSSSARCWPRCRCRR